MAHVPYDTEALCGHSLQTEVQTPKGFVHLQNSNEMAKTLEQTFQTVLSSDVPCPTLGLHQTDSRTSPVKQTPSQNST